MKKIFHTILLVFLISVFTGCKPSYHCGYLGTSPSQILNSPHSGVTNYIGGSVNAGGTSNDNENNMSVKLNLQRNYTYKYGSFSFHAEAFSGFHSVEAVEEYAGKSYDYYGFMPQLTTSLYIPVKKARIGIYGYTGTFWEYGHYDDWMKIAEADSLIYREGDEVNGKELIGGAGFIFDGFNEESIFSLKIGFGLPGGFHGMSSYRKGNNVLTFSLCLPVEPNLSIALGYMRLF